MLDIIGIIILFASAFRGWRKGIIVALFALVGVVLGMLCALKLSGALGSWMMAHGWVTNAWAQIISYLILFFGVIWLVRIVARIIEKSVQAVMLGVVNRIAGAVLYAFIGAFIWSAMLWIANRAHFIAPETMFTSKTYDFFAPIAPWVFEHIGAVLPFAKDIFSDLEHFFDGVNQHLPGHVGAH